MLTKAFFCFSKFPILLEIATIAIIVYFEFYKIRKKGGGGEVKSKWKKIRNVVEKNAVKGKDSRRLGVYIFYLFNTIAKRWKQHGRAKGKSKKKFFKRVKEGCKKMRWDKVTFLALWVLGNL